MVGENLEPLCFLNIGGVSNLTYIEGDKLLAFDIGPGNAFLDDWIHKHGAGDYDADGEISARGTVDDDRLRTALTHPFLAEPGPKSLDRYSFSGAFAEGLSLEDGAATLLAFTAEAIAASEQLLPQAPKLWLVCGVSGRPSEGLFADHLSGNDRRPPACRRRQTLSARQMKTDQGSSMRRAYGTCICLHPPVLAANQTS